MLLVTIGMCCSLNGVATDHPCDDLKLFPGIKRQLVVNGNEHNISIEVNTRSDSDIVASHIARILLQQAGYSVLLRMLQETPLTSNVYARIAGCPSGIHSCESSGESVPYSMVSLETWPSRRQSEKQQWLQTKDMNHDHHISNLGPSGYDAQSGWYFSYNILSRGKGWNVLAEHSYLSSFGYTSPYDTLLQLGLQNPGSNTTECVYQPVQCKATNASCIVAFAIEWDVPRQFLINQIELLQLNVSILWLSLEKYAEVVTKVLRSGNSTTKGVLFTSWAPSLLIHRNQKIVERVDLPNCGLTQRLESGASPSCDFPRQRLEKVSWIGLEKYAPAANHILRSFAIPDADMTELLSQIVGGSSVASVACGWVQDNLHQWKHWIPELEKCTERSIDSEIGPCNRQNLRSVTFRWKHPMHGDHNRPGDCVPGVQLPKSHTIQCPFIHPDSNVAKLILTLSIAEACLACGCVAFIAVARQHEALRHSMPSLLATLCIGCLILSTPGLSLQLVGEASISKCSSFMWFKGIGFTLLIGYFIIRFRHVVRIAAKGQKLRIQERGKGSVFKSSSLERIVVHNQIRGIVPDAPVLLQSRTKNRVAPEVSGQTELLHSEEVLKEVEHTDRQIGRPPNRRLSAPSEAKDENGEYPKAKTSPKAKTNRLANTFAVVTSAGKIVTTIDTGFEQSADVWYGLVYLGRLLLPEVVINLMLTAMDPMKPTTTYVVQNSYAYESTRCETRGNGLIISWWLYKLILLVLAYANNLMASRTGLLRANDGMHAMYLIAGWILVTFCFRHFGEQSYYSDMSMEGITQSCFVIILLSLMLGPAFHHFAGKKRKTAKVLATSYLIPYEDITLTRPIGGGSFSDVLLGKYKNTQVAIKRLRGEITDKQITAFGKEVVTHAELHHPNIVMMIGFCMKPPLLVMEYLGRGSLYRVLHTTSAIIDWTLCFQILNDTACGMAYLHAQSPRLVHADLKSPNVLVDMNWRCKIADLGLSKITRPSKHGSMEKPELGHKMSSTEAMGSLLWLAPELFTSRKVTTKSDVYAFGIIMFEAVFRQIPYHEYTPMAIPLKVNEGKRPVASLPPSVEELGSCFAKLQTLMESCWHHEASKRPSFPHVQAQLEWLARAHTGRDNWEGAVVFPAGDSRLSIEADLGPSIGEAVKQGYQLLETDLRLGYEIGDGNFGKVYEGLYLNQKVAVKQMYVENMVGNTVLEEFHKEVVVMKQLDHPNLVALLGTVDKLPKLFLVTELMERGSFWDIYHANTKPKGNSLNEQAFRLALDVARGMEYLHSKKILHRDLKSQNVWLSSSNLAKIGDFGMSRLNSVNTMTMVGSPLWCAPEILKSEYYSFNADVYSFSIILFESFHWCEPYDKMSVMEIMVAVTEVHERPEIDASIPEDVCALICDAWQPNPEARPPFSRIVKRLEQMIVDFQVGNENLKRNSDKRNSDKRNSDKRNSDKRNSDKWNSDKRNSDKRNSDKRNSDKRNSDKRNSDKRNSDKRNSDKRDSDMRSIDIRQRDWYGESYLPEAKSYDNRDESRCAEKHGPVSPNEIKTLEPIKPIGIDESYTTDNIESLSVDMSATNTDIQIQKEKRSVDVNAEKNLSGISPSAGKQQHTTEEL